MFRRVHAALYRRIAAQAGLARVGPAASCLLTRTAAQPDITLADLAEEIGTSTANLAPSLGQLVSHRLVATDPRGGAITLTEYGRSAIERLRVAREDDLRELLDGWLPEQEPELDQRLRSLARDHPVLALGEDSEATFELLRRSTGCRAFSVTLPRIVARPRGHASGADDDCGDLVSFRMRGDGAGLTVVDQQPEPVAE